ncbi:PTS lactose/cellobiose transporter subunit IIA [Amedibacillus dolichus]|uniref:PTS lactose/cellobiose transporter subunit IIA n=1 Tax=Amedibacillus dolichus TaxID=31971 RepID=UPI001EDB1912|nr:PTS lactose/cellobiose transporter subunit IIA [Amedibacillus dolichus]MCG4880072.1 PTS lactose/cellobiose transporter subunit IIA [Amedibacillus dolichus]
MDEQIVQSAMAIILHAGDARVACKKALDSIAEGNFEKANMYIKEAQAKITEAHKVQTDAIQGETRGEKSEYSLLFAHAQDTLMTIYSEINIAKQMVKIFNIYEERLSKLENK